MQITDSEFESRTFPWYDSLWLSKYARALSIIRAVCPDAEEEFKSAFEKLTVDEFFKPKQLTNVLGCEARRRLKALIKGLLLGEMDHRDLLRLGRLVTHNHSEVSQIHRGLTDFVSELVGEQLEPSYNFLSLYNNFGKCDVHMDSPESKWTVDICIEQSEPWPIYISQPVSWPESFIAENVDWRDEIIGDPGLSFESFTMQENEGVVFGAGNQWHYRKRISRTKRENFCHLVFFQFVPSGTGELLDPSNWHRLFNIPELAELSYPCRPILDA